MVQFVTGAEPTKYYATIYQNHSLYEERVFITSLSDDQEPSVFNGKLFL